MNLEKLGLQELSTNEQVEINGGADPVTWGIFIAIALLFGVATNAY
mgnify:CR=1 FL=1